MQEVRTVPVGGSLQSFTPGFPIAALQVNNSTASWLRVNEWWIPPFTFDWMHSFIPRTNRVTVASAIGPDGQAIIAQGTPATVIAHSTPQRNSNGIHYLSNP